MKTNNKGGSFFHCACIIAYRDMKHLESSESTQIKAMVTRHRTGWSLWPATSFTRDCSIFSLCLHGNLTGYTSNFKYRQGGSVRTEHLNAQIFKWTGWTFLWCRLNVPWVAQRSPISWNSTRKPKKIRRLPSQFVTLRVAQFVLKIAHLAISMELRGLRACGLLPRLWLLVADHVN